MKMHRKHYPVCKANEKTEKYAAGGEMTENIDAAGGKGTAEFAAKAIAEYCKKISPSLRRLKIKRERAIK